MTPTDQLRAARRARHQGHAEIQRIRANIDRTIKHAITAAHDAGLTYDEIAATLGMSRQAMTQLYR